MNIKQKLLSEEVLFLLGVSAVPVDIWTVYWMVDLIPPWLRSNTAWDFTGLIAYTLGFAFLEILLIFLPLLVFRMVLPDTWAKEKFFAFGFLFIAEVSSFALLLQFVDSLFWQKRLLVIAFIGGLIIIFLLVHFLNIVNRICKLLADRLAILGFFFLIFNLSAVVIVIIRNVF